MALIRQVLKLGLAVCLWLHLLSPANGLTTAVYGGDFGQNFASSFRSGVVNMAMADMQQIIGSRYMDENGNPINGGERSFGHVSEHTILGCFMGEALGGTCATGALAGMGQAIYAGRVDPDRAMRDRDNYLNNALTIGGLFAALGSGGDVNATMTASGIARSGFENNYLNHEQRALSNKLKAELAQFHCEIDCTQEEYDRQTQIYEQLKILDAISASNTIAAYKACSSGSSDCARHLAAASADLENLGGWLGGDHTVSAGTIQSDIDWGGNLDKLLVDVYSGVGTDRRSVAVANRELIDRIIRYDGRLNATVGTVEVVGAVLVIGGACAGTVGAACVLAIVGGGAVAVGSGDELYDGAVTLASGEAQQNPNQRLLERWGYSPEEAARINARIGFGATLVELAAGGVGVFKAGKMVGMFDNSASGKPRYTELKVPVTVDDAAFKGERVRHYPTNTHVMLTGP